MRPSVTTLSVFLPFQVIAMAALAQSSTFDANLRGAIPQNKTLENLECTLFLKETRFMIPSFHNGEEKTVLDEEKWACEFDGFNQGERFEGPGNIPTTVELEGIEKSFLESHGAKSGRSTLLVSKATIGASNGRQVLVTSPAAIVQVLEHPDDADETTTRQRRSLAATSGILKTLVVRVISKNGIEPTASIDQLRSDVFYDKLCLKSQYEACSYGHLEITPFTGMTKTGKKIKGGVVDVRISVNPSDGNRDILEADAKKRATEIYGDLASQFDLVMFTIPPGTGDWLAYAYINRFDSYFNDRWSSSVSAQLHEVGHSLGLAHSGEGSSSYGDQSGMMGFSYDADDAPNMCFNPAKSYQLGWYSEQQKFLNPLTDILAKGNDSSNSFEYTLNGVDDFRFGRNGSKDKLIVLRLKQQNSREDFYLGFNRRKGMNSGTVENGNDVTIIQKTGGPIEYGQSWKVATLSARGDSYTINNFDGSSFDVSVQLLSIVDEDAKVSVSLANSAPCSEVEDSTYLRFKNKDKKNCVWVSKLKQRRCSKIWKNELLSEWCPRSCGSCSD